MAAGAAPKPESEQPMTSTGKPETLALHADDGLEPGPDVAPALHPTTTYAADNAQGLVYSRNDQPTRQRLEAVLGALEGGHAVVYGSGLAAVGALLHHLHPKRVAIGGGYHGTHAVIAQWAGLGVASVPLDAELGRGDVLWVETPKNPMCEVADIAEAARRAHQAGAWLAVDSTFATPVLQQPLALGADFVMHSSTKFLAGHSDALGGVLAVKEAERAGRLRAERAVQGSVLGVLETWLTLRSLRTLTLRVERQSGTATRLAGWLAGKVPRVWHPSLPGHPGYEVAREQMRGPGGVLSIELDSEELARALPAQLKLFRDATSLGGVESLIEWRKRHDAKALPALLRVSVGLEHPDDLIEDLRQGLRAAGLPNA
jgi:cystathionine gamma-synthase